MRQANICALRESLERDISGLNKQLKKLRKACEHLNTTVCGEMGIESVKCLDCGHIDMHST